MIQRWVCRVVHRSRISVACGIPRRNSWRKAFILVMMTLFWFHWWLGWLVSQNFAGASSVQAIRTVLSIWRNGNFFCPFLGLVHTSPRRKVRRMEGNFSIIFAFAGLANRWLISVRTLLGVRTNWNFFLHRNKGPKFWVLTWNSKKTEIVRIRGLFLAPKLTQLCVCDFDWEFRAVKK